MVLMRTTKTSLDSLSVSDSSRHNLEKLLHRFANKMPTSFDIVEIRTGLLKKPNFNPIAYREGGFFGPLREIISCHSKTLSAMAPRICGENSAAFLRAKCCKNSNHEQTAIFHF